MPADKNWIYDPLRNHLYNCPAHHPLEVYLVSWRLEISEKKITYDDTQNVMIIDGHTHPIYFAKEPDNTSGIRGTPYRCVQTPHTLNPHNYSFSRFEVFPHAGDIQQIPK